MACRSARGDKLASWLGRIGWGLVVSVGCHKVTPLIRRFRIGHGAPRVGSWAYETASAAKIRTCHDGGASRDAAFAIPSDWLPDAMAESAGEDRLRIAAGLGITPNKLNAIAPSGNEMRWRWGRNSDEETALGRSPEEQLGEAAATSIACGGAISCGMTRLRERTRRDRPSRKPRGPSSALRAPGLLSPHVVGNRRRLRPGVHRTSLCSYGTPKKIGSDVAPWTARVGGIGKESSTEFLAMGLGYGKPGVLRDLVPPFAE